ncbi:MAG: hypothetical protein FWG70_10560 [Oscillospiraceae bacterium]|nr:hypothetical protein [Oscillospiraceae bacterium]
MKKILFIFIFTFISAITLTSCGKQAPPDTGLDGIDAPPETVPEILTEAPMPLTTPVSEKPPVKTEEAVSKPPPPPYISIEEAADFIKMIVDPNDEINFEFRATRTEERDEVFYYVGFGFELPKFTIEDEEEEEAYLGLFYVDKLTGEVFLSIREDLFTYPVDEEVFEMFELLDLAAFVENFNGGYFNLMPVFNDINEIPLKYFITLYHYVNGYRGDYEYTYEEIEEFKIKNSYLDDERLYYNAHGVETTTIENYMQNNYNSDFNTRHYDWSSINGVGVNIHCTAIWEEERNAVLYVYDGMVSGGNGTECMVIKTEKKDEIYYAVAVDYKTINYQGYIEGYYLNTVKKNDNGDFNIISKQPVDIKTVYFTEEELNYLKSIDVLMIEDEFIISTTEAKNIVKRIRNDENSDYYINYFFDNIEDNYYIVSVYENDNFDKPANIYSVEIITGEVSVYEDSE